LKEKLAAARAAGGGAAAPAPVAAKPKPAATAGAAAAPAAKAAPSRAVPPLEKATDPRDLAEHLRRAGVEREKEAKAAAAAKAPASKAAPKRAESKVVPPRPGREAAASGIGGASRRQLMKVGFWIAAGWLAFTAGMGTLLAMSARFFFPNVLAEPPSTIKVGSPGDFERNQVEERWKAEWGFWIVRSDAYDGEDKIYALSSICTHLGCPPNWLAGEQKFKCPCHGSGFYISGVNFEGPAPRPLERYKLTIGDDGQLVVDKSAKFQEELGQWKDPESYLKV
jgi:cytochrome b6-f complex iron-sulfur subunit